jgi:hypothetical protein
LTLRAAGKIIPAINTPLLLVSSAQGDAHSSHQRTTSIEPHAIKLDTDFCPLYFEKML